MQDSFAIFVTVISSKSTSHARIFLCLKKFSAPVFSANLWLKAKSACFASVNLKTLAIESSPPGKNVKQILSYTEAHVRQNRFN